MHEAQAHSVSVFEDALTILEGLPCSHALLQVQNLVPWPMFPKGKGLRWASSTRASVHWQHRPGQVKGDVFPGGADLDPQVSSCVLGQATWSSVDGGMDLAPSSQNYSDTVESREGRVTA